MRKKYFTKTHTLRLLMFFLTTIVFASCAKKEISVSHSKLSSEKTNAINKWFVGAKTDETSQTQLWLDSLSAQLDLNAAMEFNCIDERTLTIIPIRGALNILLKSSALNDNSDGITYNYLAMVKFNKSKSFSTVNIVKVVLKQGESLHEDIASNLKVLISPESGGSTHFSGSLTCFSAYRDFLFQRAYEKGKVASFSMAKAKAGSNQRNSTSGSSTIAREHQSPCTDWNLVTTTYDHETGSVLNVAEEYLYTTCAE